MAEKCIKCPFCEGVAHVRQNRRLDPFISCPTCGAINARGAKYRAYIERNQYEREPTKPPVATTDKPLYKTPVFSADNQQEDWLQEW